MPVDYAIYLSQNVKSILNRGAGHNRLVKGYGRGRGVRERVTANVRVIDSKYLFYSTQGPSSQESGY